jgi:hypothetical protein
VYAGLNVPLSKDLVNQFSIDALYGFSKGYIGAGYQPYTNSFSIKAGIKIFKFKRTK